MAITLPSNLYSGEAERFNSMPHVQFQTQLLAKRKAKEDALDEYYKTLPTKINDKGVRDNEREIISKGVGELQDFWMKNRPALKNPKLDNGATQLAYEKMYRDLNDVVGRSQTAGKEGLEFGKKYWEKGNEYLHHDDGVIGDLAAWELPVNDPNHKSLSLTRLSMPERPFDQSDYSTKELSKIKLKDADTPVITPHPTDKYSDVVTIPKVLDAEGKTQLANTAATRYETDYGFKNFIDNTLAKDKDNLSKIADDFKSAYGHPVNTPHDLATAFSLSILPKDTNRPTLKDNGLRAKEAQQRGFAHAEKMENLREAHRKAAKDLGKGEDEVNINDVYKNIVDATDNPYAAIIQDNKRVGTRLNTLNADAQKTIINYAKTLQPQGKIGNDNIYIHKDNNGVISVYKTGEDGKVIQDKAHLVGELPRVTVNLPAQPSVKEKRAVIQQGNNSKPASKRGKLY